MTRRANYLRRGRKECSGTDNPPDYVPESEADANRRRVREWLRDREPDEFYDAEEHVCTP